MISPMTATCSRSRGRKSWSISRSAPASANAPIMASASSKVPVTHRPRRSSIQPLPSPLTEHVQLRLDPCGELRGCATDEGPGHDRSRDGPRVTPDGLTGGVQPGVDRGHLRGRRPAHVVLVRVPRRQAQRAWLARPTHDEVRTAAAIGAGCRSVIAGPEQRSTDLPVGALERPAIGLVPEATEDDELLLHLVDPCLRVRIRQTQLGVLGLVPARTNADLHPPAAHLVHGRHDLGERTGDTEGDRRYERAELDPARLPSRARRAWPTRRWYACRSVPGSSCSGPSERTPRDRPSQPPARWPGSPRRRSPAGARSGARTASIPPGRGCPDPSVAGLADERARYFV